MALRLTQEQWIAKATELHKGKYDYSKVIFNSLYKKVTIICPVHGEFEQKAYNHSVLGKGCYPCAREARRLSPSKWIEIATAMHGETCDYSKTNYEHNRKKVTVTCKLHGDFTVIPANHTSENGNSGCRQCGKDNARLLTTKTTEQFIVDAVAVHGATYDYSLTVYTKNADKVTIICKKHGAFQQEAGSHLKGNGCYSCWSEGQILDQSIVIDNCKRVHGDTYDYSKTVYEHSSIPMVITCRIHGDFIQNYHTHLNGSGCKQCGAIQASLKSLKGVNGWVESFRLVHGYRYDYSLNASISCKDKVKIICKDHGVFEQSAISHARGSGCLRCIGRCHETVKESFLAYVSSRGYTLDSDYISAHRKVNLTCPSGHKFSATPNAFKTKGQGCPTCAGHNQQEAYINQVLETGAVKYGIANSSDVRIRLQNIKNVYKMNRIARWHFPTVEICKAAERECKNTFKPVLDKTELKDGYTETTYAYNYDRIVAIYEKHGGVLMEEDHKAA